MRDTEKIEELIRKFSESNDIKDKENSNDSEFCNTKKFSLNDTNEINDNLEKTKIISDVLSLSNEDETLTSNKENVSSKNILSLIIIILIVILVALILII